MSHQLSPKYIDSPPLWSSYNSILIPYEHVSVHSLSNMDKQHHYSPFLSLVLVGIGYQSNIFTSWVRLENSSDSRDDERIDIDIDIASLLRWHWITRWYGRLLMHELLVYLLVLLRCQIVCALRSHAVIPGHAILLRRNLSMAHFIG